MEGTILNEYNIKAMKIYVANGIKYTKLMPYNIENMLVHFCHMTIKVAAEPCTPVSDYYWGQLFYVCSVHTVDIFPSCTLSRVE